MGLRVSLWCTRDIKSCRETCEKKKKRKKINNMTCPSVERTRALRQRLFTPVKVSSDPPVHSRGGYAAWAATPVCLLSLRDVVITGVFASSVGKSLCFVDTLTLLMAQCCPFSFYCKHEAPEFRSGKAWHDGQYSPLPCVTSSEVYSCSVVG